MHQVPPRDAGIDNPDSTRLDSLLETRGTNYESPISLRHSDKLLGKARRCLAFAILFFLVVDDDATDWFCQALENVTGESRAILTPMRSIGLQLHRNFLDSG